ncbi:superoxide dismutase [Streptomyces sp. NPDC007904]|jgi:outer membrane protein assembly factor BamB|uniref:superoxide dismutase n=1 Tax=Streptomyces sp. NPDC007904 TaxID=3364787 RepID=UPI0036E0A331
MQNTLSRRRLLGLGAAVGGAAVLAGTPAGAWAATRPQDAAWPTRIELPTGFHPGGVATDGRSPYAYYGSLFGGDVYRVDLATGQGKYISPDLGEGNAAAGIRLDCRGRLFVSGAYSGQMRVLDVSTGQTLATYQMPLPGATIADVALTTGAAWFTDAFHAVVYKLPLGPAGELPAADQVVTVPLSGDWVQGGEGEVTTLGVSPTPDGRGLILAHVLDGGGLMRVTPDTGVARRIPLGGASIPSANGIRLDGTRLYVAQSDGIGVLQLNQEGTRGALLTRVTDPDFDWPSAVAVRGDRLYVSNFGPLTPTSTTPYHSTAVPLVRRFTTTHS